jgi:hypothetical protein
MASTEGLCQVPVHAIEVTITDEMRAELPRKFQVVIPDEADGRLWVR